jgi:hypothetical protein
MLEFSGVNGLYQRFGPTANFYKCSAAEPETCFMIKKLEPNPENGGSAMWVLQEQTDEWDDDYTLFTSSAHPLQWLAPLEGVGEQILVFNAQAVPPILKFD